MTDQLSIAIAQVNPTVGALEANVAAILALREQAADKGADLMVCGEFSVAGYPPEDLVLKPAFQDHVKKAVERLAEATNDGGPGLIVGGPHRNEDGDGGLYNAAFLLDGGEIKFVRAKRHLPNYGVFDERRLFTEGAPLGPVNFRGVRLGLMVCEDMWYPDVAETLEESGAEIMVVINASPYEVDKPDERMGHAVARVTETTLPLMYVNLVGGQDELVFDGTSFVLNGSDRSLQAQCPSWEEGLWLTRWERGQDPNHGGWACVKGEISAHPPLLESIYRTLMLGIRDYVDKNGFPGVIIGLSGGIDSALSAAVAVDALGPERVRCVMMPSPFTARESIEDAEQCADALAVRLDSVSIEPAMMAFNQALEPLFGHKPEGVVEENIQPRARALILMALSNDTGFMLLTTGNKSEMSVGYATLYGDMSGGYSVLKDVYKTVVYQLAVWRNEHHPDALLGPSKPVIPERIITKPPTAELKPDQTDQETLPPYEELDEILNFLIEEEHSLEEIRKAGFDEETARKVWRMLDRAEYKRRQAPPGVKISSRSFGKDRRYPITNGFTKLV